MGSGIFVIFALQTDAILRMNVKFPLILRKFCVKVIVYGCQPDSRKMTST